MKGKSYGFWILATFLVTSMLGANALAQVNGPWISDPETFTKVVRIPPQFGETTIALNEGETGQLNIFLGAEPEWIHAASGMEVNIGGGIIENGFTADAGSEVNITGGRIRSPVEINAGSLVNMRGGNIIFGAIPEITGFGGFTQGVLNMSGGLATDLEASPGSQVSISGGTILGPMHAKSGSTVNIDGGSFRVGLRAESGSVVNITGGNLGPDFIANDSEVTISGGNFRSFKAGDDSVVSLIGTDFMLDGVALDNLVPGQAHTISERNDSILSGLLADGSAFDFELSTSLNDLTGDGFSSSALLSVTLLGDGGGGTDLSVDEVCTALANGIVDMVFDVTGDGRVDESDLNFTIQSADSLLGDVDFDGTVAFADFLTLSQNFGATNGGIYSAGDMDCNREVGFTDFLLLSNSFGQSSSATETEPVPEPNTSLLLSAAGFLLATQRRRRRKTTPLHVSA